MKKLVVLAGIAAAVYGAKRLFSAKETEAGNAYGTAATPQPQA